MLTTLSTVRTHEADEYKNRVSASTQTLKAYYQQPGASQFNFNEVLDAHVTLTDLNTENCTCRGTEKAFRT